MHPIWSPPALLGFSVFALLAGCGGGGDGSGGGMVVEVGTGALAFEPVAPDGDWTLVAGPQGGHHFIVNARARGLVPGDPTRPGSDTNPVTTFSVYDTEMNQVDLMPPPYQLGYEATPDGWFSLTSGHIAQVIESQAARLVDTRVLIRVELHDSAGHAASDERWAHAVAAPVTNGADAGPADAGTGDGGTNPDAS